MKNIWSIVKEKKREKMYHYYLKQNFQMIYANISFKNFYKPIDYSNQFTLI